MKKIMFYINSIQHGGAERVITNLATELSNDYEVILATTLKRDNEYSLDSKVKRYILEENDYVHSTIKRNISRVKRLRKLCREEKPDALISFMAEPNYRAVLATRGLGIKTIISVRNDPNKEYAGSLGHFLAKHLLIHADGCVFQTEEAQKWFPLKFQKKSKIIFNAVADVFYHTERNTEIGTIVTCGRLEPQKNHSLLIKAFAEVNKEFPNSKLLIYGVGCEKAKLEKLVDCLRIKGKVHFMGLTDNVPDVLSKANLFVLSSDYEGMPNALMEALTVGVPCISTDCPCGGPKMLVENGVNGLLVPVGDENQMRDMMVKVLSKPDFADELGRRAKIQAEEFRPEKVIVEWKQYIENITN